MAIAETAAVASIIKKLLSMSTDLIERKESREVMAEIREIQKLTIELHSLYTVIETKHHEIESTLQEKITNSTTQNLQLEKALFNLEREKDELLKRFDEWDQYERKTSTRGFVYYKHKSELHVYACAICKNKEPYPVVLQPFYQFSTTHRCRICHTEVSLDV